jgi:protein-S-isoprenylcysteine O-methyltransferase Ste14
MLRPIVFSFVMWAISEFYVEIRLMNKDGKAKNKGSSLLLTIVSILLIIVAFLFQENYRTLSYIGVLVTLIGIVFRQYSIYILGSFFSVNIRIKDGHQLIKTGPYKMFRHPSYFGSVISFLGLGMSSGDPILCFILPIVMITVYFYRVKVEEEVLIKEFEDYTSYKKNTWGFLPFVK